MYKLKLLYFTMLLLTALNLIKSDSVCDLETLKMEIRQDLADNGMLDCLRTIEIPNSVVETEKQKNLRLAAQWDTECAFESTSDWQKLFKDHYKIATLIDSVGEPVMKRTGEQAVMCEIVR
jgi:hypothetical protein